MKQNPFAIPRYLQAKTLGAKLLHKLAEIYDKDSDDDCSGCGDVSEELEQILSAQGDVANLRLLVGDLLLRIEELNKRIAELEKKLK